MNGETFVSAVGIATEKGVSGLLGLGLDGALSHIDAGFAETLGIELGALADYRLVDVFHPDDRGSIEGLLQDMAGGGCDALEFVSRIQAREDGLLWCRVHLQLMRDQQAQPNCIVAVVHAVGTTSVGGARRGGSRPLAAADSGEGVVLTNEGIILDCDDAVPELLGTSRENLIGHSVLEFLLPEYHAQVQKLIDDNSVGTVEIAALRSDSKVVYVEARIQQSLSGHAGAQYTLLRNVSQQRQRQVKLARLNRIFRALRQCDLAMIELHDEQRFLETVKQIVGEYCGYALVYIGLFSVDDPDDLQLRAVWGVDEEEAWPRLSMTSEDGRVSSVFQAILTGRPQFVEDIQRNSELSANTRAWARSQGFNSMLSVPLIVDGKVIGVISILSDKLNAFFPEEMELLEALVHDISLGLQVLRTRQAEADSRKALARKTRELEALLDTIPALVYLKDTELRHIKVNQFYCRSMGLPQDEIIGKTNADLYPPELARQCDVSDRLAMAEGPIMDVEESYIDADGKRRWFASSKTPYFDGNNVAVGMVGVSTDVTERKLAEKERIERLQRQRFELVREVHHRIKNHLQGLVGLLRLQIKAYPAVAEPLSKAIAQVCSIAEVYGLQSQGTDSRIALTTMIDAICKTPASGARIRWQPPQEGGEWYVIAAESVPVALVINELLTNAIKHSRAPEHDKTVTLTLEVEAESACLRISSGPGSLPEGFDFGAGKGLGTGLGLLDSLMPRPGADLTFQQEGDVVTAELTLRPPVIKR